MTRTPPAAPCMDCGTDTTPCRDPRGCPHHKRHRCKHNSPLPWEWYMIEDHLWAQLVGPNAPGYLCIGCLKQRLGRPLTRDDFADRPINRLPGRWDSDRLRAALERPTLTPDRRGA
jgi:hypothetical protein